MKYPLYPLKSGNMTKMVQSLKQKQFLNGVSVLITLAPHRYLFVDRVKKRITLLLWAAKNWAMGNIRGQ